MTQVQSFAEALRAQAHEYSNKLYTISGLIQLQSYGEALKFISKETTGYQDLIQFLMKAVPDTLIAAILLGKYTRAQELKIDFELDPESSLRDLPETVNREKIVTILGNLLENAFEAVLDSGKEERKVKLFMTDLGEDLIFEVEDSGNGIPDDQVGRIFSKGYTTKDHDGNRARGLGLYLVDKSVKYLNGYITLSESDGGGAVFTVVIPKKRG